MDKILSGLNMLGIGFIIYLLIKEPNCIHVYQLFGVTPPSILH